MRQTTPSEPRITLEAKGTDAREVFVELFRQAGTPFVLHVALERPLYLTLREVPFLKALQLLCEATDTRFSVRDGVYLILPRQPQQRPKVVHTSPSIKLSGTGMKLTDVARALEAGTGIRIEIAPGTPELRYNLNLPTMPLEQVLDALCRNTGLRWERTERGYRIMPAEPPRLKAGTVPIPSPSGSIRGSRAQPRTTPNRTVPPDQPLQCPRCHYALQPDWKYCPLCGAWVKPLTDRARRGQR